MCAPIFVPASSVWILLKDHLLHGSYNEKDDS